MKAFIGSRKGLIVLKNLKGKWQIEKSFFDGVKASYVNCDPHTGAIWAGIAHGHWGPKLHVSTDKGRNFKEVGAPKFPTENDGKSESLKDFWAFAADSKGRIYVGTEPAGLFHSDDQGKTWTFNEALNNIRGKEAWFGAGTDATALHSILINPENADHILIGISVAGVLQSKNRGKTWEYSNRGQKAYFLPDHDAEIGQDPHLIERAASNPSILWQQNHCGIFKSEDGGNSWLDFSKAKGVKSGFGWAVAIDEKDANIVYTVPALSDENRIPIKKKLIVQKTTNGGKSWKILNKGLPDKNCYDIVYRHALSVKENHILFGTTTGHVYFSKNQGESWQMLPNHLPAIYSVKLV